MSNRRVVVTGIGVVSPIGSDLKSFWENVVGGKSGIRPITQFDSSTFDCHIAGEVPDFKPSLYFKNPKDVRRADRFAQFAMASAKLAIEGSGLDLSKIDPTRFGVLVGSGIGGLKSLEDQHTILMNKGASRVSPFMVAMMIVNMASGLISMEYDLEGPTFSIVTACATAANSIGEAWRMIRYGEGEIFLAGGSEAVVCPLGIAGFCSMRAMSTRNEEPEKASRPFDRDRDGFVMGEGAGILVLEDLGHALARDARIHGEV